jgi:tRNA-dihydrouridine synthase B
VHGRTRNQFYSGSADWRAVADVKTATKLPVIVNGDIVDASSARLALMESGADAVMIGRVSCGRPWIASAIDRALQTEQTLLEPGPLERLSIALEHFEDSLNFYGVSLGLRVFRKHLAWYVESSAWMSDTARRVARSYLCRLETPQEVVDGLKTIWADALILRLPVEGAAAHRQLRRDRTDADLAGMQIAHQKTLAAHGTRHGVRPLPTEERPP